MFSLKRLLSFTVSAAVMLSAGVPSVSAAGVSVSPAAEAAVSGKVSAGYAPDWVPDTYLDALEFSNKYGATHVEGRYACVVQQRSKSENAFYAMECVAGNSNNNISYDFSGNLYFSAEDAPDKSDTEAYEAYLKRLKAAGISEDTTELDNYFRVEVYESIFSGFDVTLEEGYYSGDDLVINSSNVYSFGYYLSLFNLEERDIFSFMPDSVEEYDEFIKEHGNVCAFNNYVIYCGDVPRYSGVELQMEQNGNARIKEFKSYTIGERVADMGNISDGGSVRTVRMYEGIDWGEVNVDFNLVRFDNTVVQKASNNFTIERDEAQRVDFSIVMNRDDLPEWVPTDYAEALAFENEHGSSYIADGYICCMRRLRRNGKKRIYFSESAHNVIDDCQVCSKVFRFPSYDENEQGSYEKYLADLEKLGLDERTAENANKDKKLLTHMREKLLDFQDETGNMYNLEATPAEGTTYRFAREDQKRYPDIIQAGTKEAPYYTNSSQLPVGFTDDPFVALDYQDDLQTQYTGGTVLHLYMSERISSSAACKDLVRRVLENYRLPYVSVTPVYSICPKHGYIPGEHKYCPICDQELLDRKHKEQEQQKRGE